MNINHGNFENIVLNALWNMEENDQETIDVSDVQNKINTNTQSWAYTTIKTVLDRLVEKGLVKRVKQGKKYFYQSVLSREIMGREAIKKLAKQYFNDNTDDLLKAVENLYSEAFVIVR